MRTPEDNGLCMTDACRHPWSEHWATFNEQVEGCLACDACEEYNPVWDAVEQP